MKFYLRNRRTGAYFQFRAIRHYHFIPPHNYICVMDWLFSPVYDAADKQLYQHFLSWIQMHPEIQPPNWAVNFAQSCCRRIDPTVQVHLVPCSIITVSERDFNEGRLCEPNSVPCMQFTTRSIFYPIPHEDTPPLAWKQGLLHEFAHLCPPNSRHDDAFQQQFTKFCNLYGIEPDFQHVRGFLF